MALHPLASSFGGVAGEYDRGRPEYAPAVVEALVTELGLQPSAPVLDLAAGTGKLTRALHAAGLDVCAVEPQHQLRELLIAGIGVERVREGVAEAIPFADESFAAVTVADAFHWFDQAPALAEIARVLRPGGGIAVLTMVPDWGGASWAHAVGALVAGLRPKHPHFDGPPWQQAVRGAGGWSEPRELRLEISQPADRDRFVNYLASLSWIATLPQARRVALLEQVTTLVSEGEAPADLPVHVVIGLADRV